MLCSSVHAPSVQGFAFDIDSETVLTAIKELFLGTEAEAWVKNIKCGGLAMQELRKQQRSRDAC